MEKNLESMGIASEEGDDELSGEMVDDRVAKGEVGDHKEDGEDSDDMSLEDEQELEDSDPGEDEDEEDE